MLLKHNAGAVRPLAVTLACSFAECADPPYGVAPLIWPAAGQGSASNIPLPWPQARPGMHPIRQIRPPKPLIRRFCPRVASPSFAPKTSVSYSVPYPSFRTGSCIRLGHHARVAGEVWEPTAFQHHPPQLTITLPTSKLALQPADHGVTLTYALQPCENIVFAGVQTDVCGNFNIALDRLSRPSQPHATPHAPYV